MRRAVVVGCLAGMLAASPAWAHRLDETLQATLISVHPNHLDLSMRMVPGMAVAPALLARVDADGDGALSEAEQVAYAQGVLADLALSMDGEALRPTLSAVRFAPLDQLRQGMGGAHIELQVALSAGPARRRFTLDQGSGLSGHAGAVYLVNCLAPEDPNIRILAQTRNERQSSYQLDWEVGGGLTGATEPGSAASVGSWPMAVSLGRIFRLGMQHIAEGTDHMLFLLVILLPAPLACVGRRWAGPAGVRTSLTRLLKIVTAFTLGHSLTLGIAALGGIAIPTRPVEVLIAVSILVSAAHALRPLLRGQETMVALSFGLVHGLAFASSLTELGLGRWERVLGVLAFNAGIEAMQAIVVAVAMPPLLLLSRTRLYPVTRVAGALLAAVAALGWVAERLLSWKTPVDAVMNAVAAHSLAIALGLTAVGLGGWVYERGSRQWKVVPDTGCVENDSSPP